MTREQWLNSMIKRLRPHFKAAGYVIPANVRVSVGFSSAGARNKRVIGECWFPGSSADGTHEIFLVPAMDDYVLVAATLAHELVHVVVGHAAKHGPVFRRCAKAIGLEGKMTATTPTVQFAITLAAMGERVGKFPHAALSGMHSSRRGPEKGRLVKVLCTSCGYTARTTRKWLDDVGPPHCPTHGLMMEC